MHSRILTLFSISLLQIFALASAMDGQYRRALELSSSSDSTTPTPTSSSTSSSSTATSSSSTTSISSSTSSSTSSVTTTATSSSSSSTTPVSSSSTPLPSSSSSLSSSSPVTPSASSIPPSLSSSTTPAPSVTLQNTVYSTNYSYVTSTSTPSSPSSTDSAAGGVRTASTGNGFLQNKGAVAGTFTVVGLVALALIGGLLFFLVKRQRRRREHDEVDAYFDKPIGAHGVYPSGARNSSASLEFPPAHRQYSPGNQDNFNDPQSYGLDYPPETASYSSRPVSAAPNTAYAAAIAQQGPYQYSNGQQADYNRGPARATGSNPVSAQQSRPLSYEGAYATDPYYAK